MRSLLFVPADSERKLAKGEACGADALILDLEDAVSGSRKPAAREMAAEYIRTRCVRTRPARASMCASTRSTPPTGRTTLPVSMAAGAGRHHAAQAALRRGRAHAVDRAQPCRGARRQRWPARPASSPLPPRCRSRCCRCLPTSASSTRLVGLTWGRGGPVGGARLARNPRGRRPAGPRPIAWRAISRSSRRWPPTCSRSTRCSSISAISRACARRRVWPRATASRPRWPSTPIRWPVINEMFTPTPRGDRARRGYRAPVRRQSRRGRFVPRWRDGRPPARDPRRAPAGCVPNPSPSPRSRGEGRGEGPQHTPEQVSAPHPNPLPTKSGERGQSHSGCCCGFTGAPAAHQRSSGSSRLSSGW